MEIAALFCNDDPLAAELAAQSVLMDDPLWRLPLHPGYRRMLDSKIADLHSAPGGLPGAITAALFLEHFRRLRQALGPYRHGRLEPRQQTRPA